jgi:endonuclease/exonuclease/phosphatase family metal-dependent hydrolase
MRIASFNVESLFNRPKAMNQETWADGRVTLENQAKVNGLLGEPIYTPSIKADIVLLLKALGLDKSDEGRTFAFLRQNRGHLLTRSNGKITITAAGRDDWIGWVELKTEPVNEVATANTARVIHELGAQIQAVVEADNRTALREFSDAMLKEVGGTPFDHVMLIDGNDTRGIDVGLMTRAGFDIVAMSSHVEDADAKGRIFSRDCPAFTIRTTNGSELVVLVNHFKSKGYGVQADNDALRLRQSTRVKAIYDELRAAGQPNVVVCGDFNDDPPAATLQPLLGSTDLKDASKHPTFDDGGRKGTFGNCTPSQKFDYMLLSPALFALVGGGGIFRCGAWGGKNGTMWDHYPSMTRQEQAASDHCAIFVDVAL